MEQTPHGIQVVPLKVRWLAIATGCFTAIVGLAAFGWFFPLLPAVLVLGAAVQHRSVRAGTWLMWLGAFLLSVVVLPVGAAVLFSSFHSGTMMSFSLSLAAVSLTVLCDAVLVMDGLANKNRQIETTQHWQHGLNWLVSVVAVVLSVYLLLIFRSVLYSYQTYGRLDTLLTWSALSTVVLLFDTALIVDAVKRRIPR